MLVLSGSVSVLQEHIGFPGSKNAGSEVIFSIFLLLLKFVYIQINFVKIDS